MLITDRFVMLNFPKTGSSFARSVLKELHRPSGLQRMLGKVVQVDTGLEEVLVVPFRFRPARHHYESQHGVYVQIPDEHRNKVVVSVMRDPLERIISAYEFRHWARYQEKNIDALRSRFPTFPDISFPEFVDMMYTIDGPNSVPDGMRTDIGPLTAQFIRFFARDPLRTILSLHDGMDLTAEREEHFAPVRFLHQEGLAAELTAFLSEMGYAPDRLSFIKEKPRVNTTERTASTYVTPAIVEHVLHAERFLYQLLPEYLPKTPAYATR